MKYEKNRNNNDKIDLIINKTDRIIKCISIRPSKTQFP